MTANTSRGNCWRHHSVRPAGASELQGLPGTQARDAGRPISSHGPRSSPSPSTTSTRPALSNSGPGRLYSGDEEHILLLRGVTPDCFPDLSFLIQDLVQGLLDHAVRHVPAVVLHRVRKRIGQDADN